MESEALVSYFMCTNLCPDIICYNSQFIVIWLLYIVQDGLELLVHQSLYFKY